MHILAKSKKKTLANEAYDYLKEKIIIGEIKPGNIITEKNVGDLLGMSRTPVKNALTKLELENYVKCIPGVGTVVTGLSFKDLKDIYDVRASLECLALKSAIYNINKEDINKLREEFKEGLKKYNEKGKIGPLDITDIDSSFHNLIIKNSQNNYIEKLMDVIANQVSRYQIQAYTLTDTFEESIQQHLKILNSIENNNLDEAEDLLKAHIYWSYSELSKVITNID